LQWNFHGSREDDENHFGRFLAAAGARWQDYQKERAWKNPQRSALEPERSL
jgi:hypothetical protein